MRQGTGTADRDAADTASASFQVRNSGVGEMGVIVSNNTRDRAVSRD